METVKPVILIIMDGWGCREETAGNAIALAHTPHIDRFRLDFPFTTLGAAGEAVGLPQGQMGNSEVGHLNMGAGRVVYQELTRINKSIFTGEFFQNEALLKAMEKVQNNKSALHLIGLLSDGGVHSHIEQLFTLLELAGRYGLRDNVYIHALLDGRDVSPDSGIQFVDRLSHYCQKTGIGRIATISGRYYTMDRDNRWERIRRAYNLYVYGEGHIETDAVTAVKKAYSRGETDEFVTPVSIVSPGETPVTIKNEDALILFNFRPDRVRQITRAFLNRELNEMDRGAAPVFPFTVSFTDYDKNFEIPAAFPQVKLKNTLGEWLSSCGYRQYRLAETEKYAHVTFFFNGGIEKLYPLEERYLIPSPRVATYDLKPEMSAFEVAEKAVAEIKEKKHDFMVINFANADMVGHTGIMAATVKAVEAVDHGVGLIAEAALRAGYSILITADHGNADIMIDPRTGGPFTAHTTSNVPLFLLENQGEHKLKNGGILADIAPTVLALMGLKVPPEMTGTSLLIKKGIILNPDC